MRLSNLFWCLFGVMVLNACSDRDMPDSKRYEDKNSGRFLAVQIANPSMDGTRAPGDQYTYEEGLVNENTVNSVRFYFFDTEGAPVNVDVTGSKNYVDCKEIESESDNDMPNVEKKLQAIVVINTKDGNTANVNSMAAVVNHESADLGTTSLSLKSLCEKAGDYSATAYDNKANFLMTSSVYAGNTGGICTAAILPENLCKTEEDAKKSPVDIYVERIVAKTRLKTKWDSEKVDIRESVTYNGKTYEAVVLKNNKGETIKIQDNQVYAIFTGWDVTGTAVQSNLFKKVNIETAWDLGWNWNHPEYFRSYWAMNPEGLTLRYGSYNDITEKINGAGVYCLENAADRYKDGTKSSYNPAEQLSNRTRAIIAAVLVTVGSDNTAQPVSLAKWTGADYTEEDVKAAMLNLVKDQLFTKTGDTYSSIQPSDVKLVTGQEANMANSNTESSARYLSYLQLTDEAKAKQFYTSADQTASLTPEAVNDILKSIPGAKVWHTGLTYYYTDIKHLGSNETKGLYGVVRNHIYDVNIQSITGLGTPVYNPNEVIIPQKPGDDETYIAAKINILSWRVINNNVDLEW